MRGGIRKEGGTFREGAGLPYSGHVEALGVLAGEVQPLGNLEMLTHAIELRGADGMHPALRHTTRDDGAELLERPRRVRPCGDDDDLEGTVERSRRLVGLEDGQSVGRVPRRVVRSMVGRQDACPRHGRDKGIVSLDGEGHPREPVMEDVGLHSRHHARRLARNVGGVASEQLGVQRGVATAGQHDRLPRNRREQTSRLESRSFAVAPVQRNDDVDLGQILLVGDAHVRPEILVRPLEALEEGPDVIRTLLVPCLLQTVKFAREPDPLLVARTGVEKESADPREGVTQGLGKPPAEGVHDERRQERRHREVAGVHEAPSPHRRLLVEVVAEQVEGEEAFVRERSFIVEVLFADVYAPVEKVEYHGEGRAGADLDTPVATLQTHGRTQPFPEAQAAEQHAEGIEPEACMHRVDHPLFRGTDPLVGDGLLVTDPTRVGERHAPVEAPIEDPLTVSLAEPVRSFEKPQERPAGRIRHGLELSVFLSNSLRIHREGDGGLEPVKPLRFCTHFVLFVHATGKHRARQCIPAKTKRTVKSS